MSSKTIRILGIRGLPAAHGGFETFAQYLAFYLRDRGWRVIVYCQVENSNNFSTDIWEGVERVFISAPDTSLGTIKFDYHATAHAARCSDLCLTLGYNTAVFSVFLRLRGILNIINMDGIEWRRAKWGVAEKIWFWVNERLGCWLGNHLVADHPEILAHLATRAPNKKLTMIPYGGREVNCADVSILDQFGLSEKNYLTVIARPEPENSILEIVEAFSKKERGVKLVVLGNYCNNNKYHAKVRDSASSEVVFLGAVYDQAKLDALRFYSRAYIHGHRVGGTNPSLVEALAAGNPIIAHDNKFNRWVSADSAVYFSNVEDLDMIFGTLILDFSTLELMSNAARVRVSEELNWPQVLGKYESLLSRFSK